ncbi:hybrid sensor histidine kinase/response regulator [Agrobacterium rosae]|uniref:histidine kinase n=1 Tax=Agrobacterium rosae TaxID=1972867 RepID=A0A1R3TET1_9HYPH|nr:ATP-binding protein [Agrobacterium rosae]SCX03792.1 Blue-light-activated protein [Agrobacterium rosae]
MNHSETLPWLVGGGDTGNAIRGHDWANNPVGFPANWPESLRTLVGVMLSSKQPMFLAWGEERRMFYNDGYAEMLQSRHPAAMGERLDVVWSDIMDDVGPLIEDCYRGKPTYMDDIVLYMTRQGEPTETHFAFAYTPVLAVDGSVIGVFCTTTETTERVKAERARAHAEQERVLLDRKLLAAAEGERDRLFEMSRDLFGVATFDGMLKTINPAWSRQLERSHDALLATPFAEIIHPDDLPTTGETVAALQSGKPVHQFLVRLLKADGTAVPFAWSAVPDPTPGSNSFYTVGRDISEQVAAEADLKIAQDALRQAQKMESIGQLTGGIAHDFNNLLGGISGSLEMLQKRLSQGRYTEVDKYIDGAQGAAKRAAALTHRLLAFSRRQTLDPKPTDVKILVDGLSDLVARTVGPQIEMKVIAPDDLWLTLVDPNQLENALLNLCINARDAMPDGGKLSIELSNHTFRGRAATERSLSPGNYLSVCVIDTGSGMTDEVRARAVDPFFTTKPLGQGTGLGLSMIYGFVSQSGGQIRIDSEVGKGTTICLYLPRFEGECQIDDAVETGPSVAIEGKETVLVIDDEPSIRMLAVDVLEELGYRTLEAGDGPSGLTILQQFPEVELLVTDVGLPGGMNGRQVADAARAVKPSLKVLFITGYAETSVWKEGSPEKGMQVLTKPFSVDSLTQKVGELLDR